MSGPLLNLWPHLWRSLLPVMKPAGGALACCVLVLALTHAERGSYPFLTPATIVAAVVFGLTALIELWRVRWIWSFGAEIRRFRTLRNSRITLHYPPELEGKRDFAGLLQDCQGELDELTVRFGFSLRGRVVVYLFSNSADVGRFFGPVYIAYAFFFANIIIVANDTVLREMIRHELAHLYSARWNRRAPLLFSEGISVWLQETASGQPIDTAAQPLLLDQSLKLSLFLDPSFFQSQSRCLACYILAGSFTGFLIRRHGWKQYRHFYWLCDSERFHAQFQMCFGVGLEEAERMWREEILPGEGRKGFG